MPIVRVIVWDTENYIDRISSPEDTFLIESIDASGSDSNILRIGPSSASAVMIGNDHIRVYISGILSGNFITGTFYGDGSSLRGLVNSINDFTGSVNIVAGDNVVISSGSGQIIISAVSGGATGSNDKVRVSETDLISDYLFNKVIAGSNIVLTKAYSGSNEKLFISSTLDIEAGDTRYVLTSSYDSFTGSINEFTSSQIDYNSQLGGFTSSFSSSVRSIGDVRYVLTSSYDSFTGSVNSFTSSQLLYNSELGGFTASFSESVRFIGDTRYIQTASFSIKSGPNVFVNSSSFEYSVSSSATSINGYSGTLEIKTDEILTLASSSGQFVLSSSAITSASHRNLDQLVHNIAETSYEEFIYGTSNKILTSTVWFDFAKTLKIRQEVYTYSLTNLITSSLVIQYDVTGSVCEQVLEVYRYVSGTKIESIERSYTKI